MSEERVSGPGWLCFRHLRGILANNLEPNDFDLNHSATFGVTTRNTQ